MSAEQAEARMTKDERSGYVRCGEYGTYVGPVSREKVWELALNQRIEDDKILAETHLDGVTRFYRKALR